MSQHHQILIVGGGTGGITVAAHLQNLDASLDIAIIEPSQTHYYQPIWTLVGGGVFPKEFSARSEADYIPQGVSWIQDSVTTFDPENNTVALTSGGSVSYDALIVVPGIQLNWDQVKGLKEALGKNGVCSNYAYDQVGKTWDFLKNFRGGKAVFTFPSGPIKCAGAPQKIMWLAEHHMRRAGVREQSEVSFAAATPGIFGIPKYAKALSKLAEERDVNTHYSRNLVEVRAKSREAVFEDVKGGEELVLKYDFLHVTPPQSAPNFIKASPLADEKGWIDVDKNSTQHVRYPNIFALGDASNMPNSKTGAAIRKQAPVTATNLVAFLKSEELTGSYNGYASCPLVTGYGRLILAEFGYGGVIMESFPFDQAQERYSMYALKAYALPDMYWNGMLKGRM